MTGRPAGFGQPRPCASVLPRMNDAALHREIRIAALCFGGLGLLVTRLVPPLGLALSLAAIVLGVVSLRAWMRDEGEG